MLLFVIYFTTESGFFYPIFFSDFAEIFLDLKERNKRRGSQKDESEDGKLIYFRLLVLIKINGHVSYVKTVNAICKHLCKHLCEQSLVEKQVSQRVFAILIYRL